jgi:hypothetical protein
MVWWVWDRAAPFAGWPLGLWPPDLNLADGIGVPSKKNSQHQAESSEGSYKVCTRSTLFFSIKRRDFLLPGTTDPACLKKFYMLQKILKTIMDVANDLFHKCANVNFKYFVFVTNVWI